jgi:hypothetical protein
LSKKSIFEKDSENSNEYEKEYLSSEIWGKNTKFFFDALGRKTGAHPETRRYLFATKKAYEKEPYLGFSGSISLLSKEYIEGYVATKHKYDLTWCTNLLEKVECFPSTPLMGDLTISFSFRTMIRDIEYQNDPLLKIHEDKHKEIYNSLGNKDWIETMRIDLCENRTRESMAAKHCPEMRRRAKVKFEEQLRILINAQNKWDDDDKNNVSTYRIDLQERINEMRQDVETFDCLK